jgi:hypothetical protein
MNERAFTTFSAGLFLFSGEGIIAARRPPRVDIEVFRGREYPHCPRPHPCKP